MPKNLTLDFNEEITLPKESLLPETLTLMGSLGIALTVIVLYLSYGW
jgi:hypothetical protein